MHQAMPQALRGFVGAACTNWCECVRVSEDVRPAYMAVLQASSHAPTTACLFNASSSNWLWMCAWV